MKEKLTNKQIAKKIANLLLNLILLCFFVLCVIALVFSISLKKSGNDGANIFGHQMLIVLSPSMEQCDKTDVSNYKIKSINTNSMVFVETVPEDKQQKKNWYKNINVGDVLTFKYMYAKQDTITHRVVSITPKNDGFVFVLEGDNKNDDTGVLQQIIDTTLEDTPNFIIGKVTGQSYCLGLLVTAVKSPVGITCIIIVPCIIIILIEIIKLVNMYNKNKKDKLTSQKDKEIEDLKRQLSIQKDIQTKDNSNIDN